jgi:NAD+ kinase
MNEERPQIINKRAVGLVCKPDRPEIADVAVDIVDYLQKQGLEVYVDHGSCESVHEKAILHRICDMDVDFVITIGGDGTILFTLSRLNNRDTPLFCINKGTVGFMTESNTDDAVGALQKILKNECVIESNVNLASGSDDRRFEDALNEVYVVSMVPGRLLTFRVYIDGIEVDYGRADGAMLATPGGSTAYALAAGGSVLTPNVHGLIFVPVCPPRFELKSMVIPDDSLMELELVKPAADALVVIDGQVRHGVDAGNTIWMKKSEGTSKFIRLYDNYYDRLRTRLVPREAR